MYFWNIHGNIGWKSEMAVSVSGGPRYHLGLKWWQIFSLRNNVLALASLFSVRKSFQMEENTSVLVESSRTEPVSLDNESGYEEGLNTSLDTADAGEPEQLDSLIADTSMLTLQTEVDSGHSLSTRWKHFILSLQNCLIFLSLQAALGDLILLLNELTHCEEEEQDTSPYRGQEISEEDQHFSSQQNQGRFSESQFRVNVCLFLMFPSLPPSTPSYFLVTSLCQTK